MSSYAACTNQPAATRPKFILLKMVLVAFFWGGTYVAGHMVVHSMSPLDGAVLRFLIAGAGLAVLLCRADGWRPVQWRDALLLTLMGLTGIVAYTLFFFAGLQRISASRVALINANNPIAIMLGAWLVFGEKLGQRKICGIVLSLAGAVIVALSGKELGGREGMWGELLTCGCVLSWMCYTLLARKALDRIPPLTATAYSTFAGTIVLVICAAPSTSAAKLASLSLTVWLALVFLGLLAVTLAFKWYIEGVSYLGAGRAGQFLNLVPVFAVGQSVVILGDRLRPLSLLGGLLVISGLIVTQTGAIQVRQPS